MPLFTMETLTQQRCRKILRALKRIEDVSIYMLGGILHPKASLKDASDLKQF